MMTETVVNVQEAPNNNAANKPQATSDQPLAWIKINVDYFKTTPGILKIAELVSLNLDPALWWHFKGDFPFKILLVVERLRKSLNINGLLRETEPDFEILFPRFVYFFTSVTFTVAKSLSVHQKNLNLTNIPFLIQFALFIYKNQIWKCEWKTMKNCHIIPTLASMGKNLTPYNPSLKIEVVFLLTSLKRRIVSFINIC